MKIKEFCTCNDITNITTYKFNKMGVILQIRTRDSIKNFFYKKGKLWNITYSDKENSYSEVYNYYDHFGTYESGIDNKSIFSENGSSVMLYNNDGTHVICDCNYTISSNREFLKCFNSNNTNISLNNTENEIFLGKYFNDLDTNIKQRKICIDNSNCELSICELLIEDCIDDIDTTMPLKFAVKAVIISPMDNTMYLYNKYGLLRAVLFGINEPYDKIKMTEISYNEDAYPDDSNLDVDDACKASAIPCIKTIVHHDNMKFDFGYNNKKEIISISDGKNEYNYEYDNRNFNAWAKYCATDFIISNFLNKLNIKAPNQIFTDELLRSEVYMQIDYNCCTPFMKMIIK